MGSASKDFGQPLRFGFIGLGVMGFGMANNLRSKIPSSSQLCICEIVRERQDEWLRQAPGEVVTASTPTDVAEQSDVIITMLPKGPHVWDAFTNEKTGLLAGAKASGVPKLFLDCSTIDVSTSKRVGSEVARLRVGQFVDAPVSGGVHGANTGTLSFMVGCDSDDQFERVKQILETMGRPENVFYCGKPGAGLATKQINNYLSCVTMVGTCEAMNMGLRAGLDPVKLSRVINVSTGACYNSAEQNPVKGVSPISSAQRDFNGGFTTEMCKGVLDMAVELGEQAGAKSILAELLVDFYGRAVEDDKSSSKLLGAPQSIMSSGNKHLFEAGLKNRREVVGEAYVDRALKNGSSEFAFPGQQLVTEWCWGNAWSRPGLDRKQRSLLNIGMLIALKSWPELGAHVRGAINNGLSELEVREAILHATIYCGVPAGVEAFKVADRTLNEMQENGEYKRQLSGLSPDATS